MNNLSASSASAFNSSQQLDVLATYKDAGFSLPLVALMFGKALVCLIGILLNIDLVYITARTKKLRGACNLQIAVHAFSIVIQQSSSFITFFVVLSGTNFIHLRFCVILQTIPLFFTQLTTVLGLSIGVDRLLSILYPIWYLAHDQRRPYLFSLLFLCSLFASIAPIVGLKVSFENPENPVMCTVIDPAQKEATWIAAMQLGVNCASVGCYLLFWAVIVVRNNTVTKKQVNIFYSLFAILLLEICGWITNYVVRIVTNAPNYASLAVWYAVNMATIAPYAAMALNPVMLYVFSTEYRSAFLVQFSRGKRDNRIFTTVHSFIGNNAVGPEMRRIGVTRLTTVQPFSNANLR